MTADTETRTIDATVTMYTTATCPYCIQAERFLRAKGVAEIAKVRVDLEPSGEEHGEYVAAPLEEHDITERDRRVRPQQVKVAT